MTRNDLAARPPFCISAPAPAAARIAAGLALLLAALFLSLALGAHPARAQARGDTRVNAWIQIEAQPTLREAQQKAREWSARLGARVSGFRIRSGNWYALALGPFTREAAIAEMRRLKARGEIPGDSFLMFTRQYGPRFWPVGQPQEPAGGGAGDSGHEGSSSADGADDRVAPPPVADETPAEARASERRLDANERKALQVALQWEGFYRAGIDGAFGPGTRRAMAAWQSAHGYTPTGILTTRQRAELLGGYRAVLDSLGFAQMRDDGAGIEVVLPMNMVTFDRYEAPFAHYKPINDSGVRVILISQAGDRATLYGLYDILQSLKIVPANGVRQREATSFTIAGEDENAGVSSYTRAQLVDGAVKGFILVWPLGDERRRDMALEQMKASFHSIPGMVLADNAGLDEATQSVDLVSGLEIRRPRLSRSGFFVSDRGAVATVSEAVENCARITADDGQQMRVLARDDNLGLALLTPVEPLAPMGVARLAAGTPRLGSDVAVSGYSFEGRLGAPTLTFGKLAELIGLGGEETLARLEIATEPGDAGGPVLDSAGGLVGMLLARAEGAGRRLPQTVQFAAKARAIAEFVRAQGVVMGEADSAAPLDPVDLTARAMAMTVLVSCWD